MRAGVAAQRTLVIYNGVELDHYKPDSQARDEVRKELGLEPETGLPTTVSRGLPVVASRSGGNAERIGDGRMSAI